MLNAVSGFVKDWHSSSGDTWFFANPNLLEGSRLPHWGSSTILPELSGANLTPDTMLSSIWQAWMAASGPKGATPSQALPALKTPLRKAVQAKDSGTIIADAIRANWSKWAHANLSATTWGRIVSEATRRIGGEATTWELNAVSLSSFLDLWLLIEGQSKEPVLSIAPRGTIIAEWVLDPDNFLVVDFQSDGKLIYSLFVDSYPTEGIFPSNRLAEFSRMVSAALVNPFTWSDLAAYEEAGSRVSG